MATTFLDLYQGLAKWFDLEAASTELLTERKAFINDAYRDVVSAYDWHTRQGNDTFQTTAVENTSTLQAASVGDTALTIDDAVWDTGWTNRKIRIGDDTYTVTSFGTTTTATIADGLTTALAGGEAYIIFQDEFSLPSDCGKLLEVYPGANTYAPLRRLSTNEMARIKALYRDPRNYPLHYAEIGTDANGYQTIQVAPIPETIFNLIAIYDREISEMSDDADLPLLLPSAAHHLISKRAKVYCYEMDRANESLALMKMAQTDYEKALGAELTRSRKHVSKVRLDPDAFPGAAPIASGWYGWGD